MTESEGVVRQGLTVQTAFELKPEWGEGTNLGKIWAKTGAEIRNSKCKGPGSGTSDKERVEKRFETKWEKSGEARWTGKDPPPPLPIIERKSF